MSEYPVLKFHQFGGGDEKDALFLFAPSAKHLAAWAGIPKKGWRIRMLFQRWVTEKRKNQLGAFWSTAKKNSLLSPTSIVVAIQDKPKILDGRIHLDYVSPIEGELDYSRRLQILASLIRPRLSRRLTSERREELIDFSSNPLKALPAIDHDYVYEFALQVAQMERDPEWYINSNKIDETELSNLITSMEALVRPALVVDGQHRLYGAQSLKEDVFLPVVAFADADWSGQIYQFVVINEKAEKVDSELLNDIFACSLTPAEQMDIRAQFKKVNVDIELRVAGVLAGRDTESPFKDMVTLNLENPTDQEKSAYISQAIIQNLIDGGRGARGWRRDEEFYQTYIRPRFGSAKDWEDWSDGKWRVYWFTFWRTVRDYYTPLAKKIKSSEFEIWSKTELTNLTKGVGLKMLQRFFMETMISEVNNAAKGLEILEQHLGKDKAEEAVAAKRLEVAIPEDTIEFEERVKKFLSKLPVRFFTQNWETGLDDSTGHEKILFQMREAVTRDNWRASGGGVFASGETRKEK
jgi:hypothetical protein